MKNNFKLFHGGKIVTMGEETNVEAVLVRDDTILHVGTYESCLEKAANNNVEEINLNGQCLLPGFVDPHVHILMLGMCYTWADVSESKAKSIPDIIKVLKEFAQDLEPGEAIRGFGFDQRKLVENRYPTSQELDMVSTDRPVQIMNSSGHCNVVNTFLLNKMGVTKNTPDPAGGSFVRDEKGHPTGTLLDSANDYLGMEDGVKPGEHGPNIHMPDTTNNLQKNIEVGQNLLLSAGFTAVNDAQVSSQEMESYLIARDNGLLKIRVNLSFLSNYLESVKNLGICSSFGDEQLSIKTIKLYADGSLISGTAYLSTEYTDSERTKGYLFHDAETFKKLLIDAHKQGLQTMTHTQGDAAIELVLQSVEEAQELFPRKDMRHRIEHCGLPTEKQVQKMAELSIWPIPQPQHVYLYGDGVVNSIGQSGENFSPYGWFRKYDVPIVLSSDTPVAFPNPMEAIYGAVTRRTINGNTIGKQHRISLQEALEGYTIKAAESMHRENEIGSIEEGKLADFAILDKDPFSISEDELLDVSVKETWISGEKVYSL